MLPRLLYRLSAAAIAFNPAISQAGLNSADDQSILSVMAVFNPKHIVEAQRDCGTKTCYREIKLEPGLAVRLELRKGKLSFVTIDCFPRSCVFDDQKDSRWFKNGEREINLPFYIGRVQAGLEYNSREFVGVLSIWIDRARHARR